MNERYEKIQKNTETIKQLLSSAVSSVNDISIPADIPQGDMPGDKIEIGDSHISKAKTIFPALVEELKKATDKNSYGRAVVAVCGGSGVGKSEIASLLSYMLEKAGIGSYTMSGDNYPHRIPKYNDAERLHVFREGGVRAMADSDCMTPENVSALRAMQASDSDADPAHCSESAWFDHYLEGGKKALAGYLGTPSETDFAEADQILHAFKDGADTLYLKRMGRDDSSLWYDKVDLSEKQVLILEWTHGNSDYLHEVDIPVLLNSTPEETLEHRRSRNRDGKLDSPFTMLILSLEQQKLTEQAHKAKIIITKAGELIDYETFKKLMA